MKFALGSLLPTVLGLLAITAAASSQTTGTHQAVDTQPAVKWLSNYGAARRASSKAHRPVFLVMTLDNCSHCVRMKNDIQRNRSISSSLQQDFVPLIVNGAINPVLARELRVEIYPTTVIIAPNGKVLDYMRGYVAPHSLSARMATVITSETHLARRMDD